ncbi:MAG: hypothetical protein P8X47_11150 [Ignavibacteriaceae bacterium]|jgi:hypothetical protein
MKKVLISGASGYLGKYLIKEAKKQSNIIAMLSISLSLNTCWLELDYK